MDAKNTAVDTEKKNLPGILLNTLPKSASVYTWTALAKGLDLDMMRVSCHFFPVDLIVPEHAALLAQGGVVCQEHIDASWQNKAVLGGCLDKMIVHVRDPRSSALEWAHHMLTFKNEQEHMKQTGAGADDAIADMSRLPFKERCIQYLQSALPNGTVDLLGTKWGLVLMNPDYMPEGYFDMSFEEQVGVQVGNYLPDAIRWIEGWLDAIEDPKFKTEVLMVQYEEFVKDENAYFDRILDFYGIDKSIWTFKPFTPKRADDPTYEGEFHFRNARPDEWRDSFTAEQIDKAAKMMPERLLKRFNWPER